MSLKLAYQQTNICVVRITVESQEGDLSTGTGFHIGDGNIVTARHVIEGRKIKSIDDYLDNEHLQFKNIIYPDDPRIDLAGLCTNSQMITKSSKSSQKV